MVAAGLGFGIEDHAAVRAQHGEAQAVRAAGVGKAAQAGVVARRERLADGFRGQLGAGGEVALRPCFDGPAVGVRLRAQNEGEGGEAEGGHQAGHEAEESGKSVLQGFTR